VISIRKKMEESEHLVLAFQALLKTFLDLTFALPKAALPANPELSGHCRDELELLPAMLKDIPTAKAINEASKVALQQVEVIFHSNRSAFEERDAALKDVVASVAQAVSAFRGHGERHESNISKLADDFDTLSRIEDVAELRRRLRDQVSKLRETALDIHRESEQSVRQFESQISAFQQRLEIARKESGTDRLTGLGSRREAERDMRRIPKHEGPISVLLFDIEGFREINNRYGALFGDKLLRAFTHQLRTLFGADGTLYRWGADEFLVIREGSLPSLVEQCREVCQSFSVGGKYYATLDDGTKVALAATVAFGAAQYARAESMEELYRRARMALDQDRKDLRR
jgi:diguanylate cyclase (GGDEF)-like protein